MNRPVLQFSLKSRIYLSSIYELALMSIVRDPSPQLCVCVCVFQQQIELMLFLQILMNALMWNVRIFLSFFLYALVSNSVFSVVIDKLQKRYWKCFFFKFYSLYWHCRYVNVRRKPIKQIQYGIDDINLVHPALNLQYQLIWVMLSSTEQDALNWYYRTRIVYQIKFWTDCLSRLQVDWNRIVFFLWSVLL